MPGWPVVADPHEDLQAPCRDRPPAARWHAPPAWLERHPGSRRVAALSRSATHREGPERAPALPGLHEDT
ncbi:hypothetical protein HX744_00680 [Pseudonocardia sp. ICBG1122]|nr:hypothetical protein [Pseudonocardia pini]